MSRGHARHNLSNDDGFSMIETILGAIAIGVMLVALLDTLGTVTISSGRARIRTLTDNYATAVIEDMRGAGIACNGSSQPLGAAFATQWNQSTSTNVVGTPPAGAAATPSWTKITAITNSGTTATVTPATQNAAVCNTTVQIVATATFPVGQNGGLSITRNFSVPIRK